MDLNNKIEIELYNLLDSSFLFITFKYTNVKQAKPTETYSTWANQALFPAHVPQCRGPDVVFENGALSNANSCSSAKKKKWRRAAIESTLPGSVVKPPHKAV